MNFVDYSSTLDGVKYAELETLLLEEQTQPKKLERTIENMQKMFIEEKKQQDAKTDMLYKQLEQEIKQRERSDLIFGRKIAALTGKITYMEQYIQSMETYKS